MSTNTFSIGITQLIWMISYFAISFLVFGKSNIPEWSNSIFLICFMISIYYLINVKEGEAGYPMVRNTKSLAVGSIVVIFLIRLMLDYL